MGDKLQGRRKRGNVTRGTGEDAGGIGNAGGMAFSGLTCEGGRQQTRK